MTVELPIVRVSVHPDGAIVHRRGPATVQGGRVLVGGLPVLLDPGSLRAGVEGGRLQDARAGIDLPLDERGEPVAEQEGLLEQRAELGRTLAEREHLDALRSWIGELQPTYDSESGPLTAAALRGWADLDGSLAGWRAEIDEQVAALDERVAELESEIEHLEAVLASCSTEAIWKRWSPSRRVELRVEADDGTTVEASVSYVVEGARWSPAYSIDFDRGLTRGTLAMRALVGQATGEDWRDVEITLSTAPCTRRVDLPELPALRLGTRAPERREGWRPLPDDLDRLFPEAGPVSEPPAEKGDWDDEEEERDSVDYAIRSAAPMELSLGDETSGAASPPPPRPSRAPSPPPMPSPAPGMQAPSPKRSRSRAPSMDKQKKRERLVGGGDAKPVPPPPERTGVRDDQLDYGSLRLASADAPSGFRGRLRAESEDDRLRDVDVAARSAWGRVSAALRAHVRALQGRRFPPNHVLPGPIAGHDVVHEAPGRVSIPSDARFHAISVFTEEATARIRYHAVPRHETAVFREVVAALPRAGALLPGPIEATIEGDLVLTTRFAGAGGDKEIRFGLGREDRLTVARNVRYHEESAGLLGGSRKFTTTIEVQLASALQHNVSVEVFERIPVPVNNDFEFDIVEHRPRSERWEGQADGPVLKGARRQRVHIPSGGRGTATLAYSVTLSNREELSGGDRRG